MKNKQDFTNTAEQVQLKTWELASQLILLAVQQHEKWTYSSQSY